MKGCIRGVLSVSRPVDRTHLIKKITRGGGVEGKHVTITISKCFSRGKWMGGLTERKVEVYFAPS